MKVSERITVAAGKQQVEKLHNMKKRFSRTQTEDQIDASVGSAGIQEDHGPLLYDEEAAWRSARIASSFIRRSVAAAVAGGSLGLLLGALWALKLPWALPSKSRALPWPEAPKPSRPKPLGVLTLRPPPGEGSTPTILPEWTAPSCP